MAWYSPFLKERIFLARDLSQAEIRILAQFSLDKLLIQQLCSGEDIHALVAQAILGWAFEKVKKDKKARTIAKQIHFGIVYGLQPKQIYARCKALGIDVTLSEIEDAHKKYFRTYKGVRDWREATIEQVRETGQVSTLFGHVRQLRVLGAESGYDDFDKRGAYWGNQSINSPIQGSAAEYLILAVALIDEHKDRYQILLDSICNEIHDRLDFTPRLRDLEETDEVLQSLLEKDCVKECEARFGVKMLVPFKSEASAGFRWGTLVDYDRESQSLGQLLASWVEKNDKITESFKKDPLSFSSVTKS